MNWSVNVEAKPSKFIERLPDDDYGRIKSALDLMQASPFTGDLRKLGGNVWCKRVGSYRIKFVINQETKAIQVYEIERRTSTTYRKR